VATWISDADLTTALEALFNKYGLTLPDKYEEEIVPNCNQSAFDQIITILAGRGFAKSQLDSWVQRAEYNRHIGLYWCCVEGGGMDAVDASVVATFTRLDRRAELANCAILDASYNVIQPASSQFPSLRSDVVSYGDMANDSTLRPDTFRNPRTGEWKKW